MIEHDHKTMALGNALRRHKAEMAGKRPEKAHACYDTCANDIYAQIVPAPDWPVTTLRAAWLEHWRLHPGWRWRRTRCGIPIIAATSPAFPTSRLASVRLDRGSLWRRSRTAIGGWGRLRRGTDSQGLSSMRLEFNKLDPVRLDPALCPIPCVKCAADLLYGAKRIDWQESYLTGMSR